MTCKGCEARREWIKKQTERATKRMQLCLQRLGVGTTSSNDSTKQGDGRAEQTNGPDRRSE